jgi:hypothetical protein
MSDFAFGQTTAFWKASRRHAGRAVATLKKQSRSRHPSILQHILAFDSPTKKSDTPRKAGGLMSWAASKAVELWV